MTSDLLHKNSKKNLKASKAPKERGCCHRQISYKYFIHCVFESDFNFFIDMILSIFFQLVVWLSCIKYCIENTA